MDEEEINIVNSKVQDMLFKKQDHQDVVNYLDSKKLNTETLFSYLIEFIEQEEYSYTLDNILSLIDKLSKWQYYRDEIKYLLVKYSENDFIFFIKFHVIKKYIIQFITNNLEMFYQYDFVYKMIKIYIYDENAGVYQSAADLLFIIMKRYSDYIKEKDIFKKILSDNGYEASSILLIRVLDLVIRYLNQVGDSFAESLFKSLSSKFYEYDILTKLTFLDSLDSIERVSLANIFIDEINFFTKLGSGEIDVPNELMRKIMYTFSKFYAKNFLKEKTIKNTLAIGLQFHEDNKNENYFILSYLINIFHNKEIFTFLANDENNSVYNFNENVLNAIIENYYSYDPDIKKHALELISVVSNFSLPSLVQEIFVKKMYAAFYRWEFNNNPKDDTEALRFFTDKLFKDFKTHDFIEYETKFLEALLSIYKFNIGMISYEPLLKRLIANFEFMLYLLNRRTRPQEICLLKYNIVEKMLKTEINDKNVLEQLSNFLAKGPY